MKPLLYKQCLPPQTEEFRGNIVPQENYGNQMGSIVWTLLNRYGCGLAFRTIEPQSATI
ncbi:MAG: hypothetical protein JGK17_13545 [Microcoleus sp. PH2017_10_PVI_O_A]|uniref:hypothetical protein n=1 Tax=unclassified Microcoleus TaxID=2642155 RepID=UPI001DD64821|nr:MULTISPECIES: hypothetical protein [unclassified Microcoleus]MCC3406587.1 hypothetical protein [Microcoleus sp. PH2017_10_PVI_O_A]MCC3479091.1 hypothetical protein [Microcoleus sp. PH2017_12_PCY_D_A]MCC3528902.1 hypothetical protein [Microcoleus sp. PH2017_21_RUC_O_A]MCC3541101.1 hypothetical protein [Microcoleus sp. PH2017_22_RUC_O_B]